MAAPDDDKLLLGLLIAALLLPLVRHVVLGELRVYQEQDADAYAACAGGRRAGPLPGAPRRRHPAGRPRRARATACAPATRRWPSVWSPSTSRPLDLDDGVLDVGDLDGERRGEGLGGDQVAVGLGPRRPRRRAPRRERDPVADLEPGVPAGLLHRADDVAGEALGLELGRDARCRARRSRRRGSIAGRGVRRRPPATVSRAYSPSSSTMPPARDRAVGADRPVAGLAALDRGLHVLAEPRTGGARVDRQPLRRRRTPRPRRASASSRRTALTLSSSATIGRSGQRVRVVDHDGERRRAAAGRAAPRALRSAEPAEQTSRTWSIAATSASSAGSSSASGQSVRCTLRRRSARARSPR